MILIIGKFPLLVSHRFQSKWSHIAVRSLKRVSLIAYVEVF